MSKGSSLKIAVVGGGVAGITAAHILQKEHNVSLFEKNSYLGGHTNTITIEDGPDAGLAVDTGFIVLNDRTYPLLIKLFEQLDVSVRFSDMSFGYHCESSDLQYAGTTVSGLFAQRKNIIRPRFWSLILGISKFCKKAQHDLSHDNFGDATLGDYLSAGAYSSVFIEDYLLPMGGAIWSAPRDQILQFPIKSFVDFFNNHGLLSIVNRPNWQTVVGGSFSYVKAFIESFSGNIELNAEIASVEREAERVKILFKNGESQEFDKVVFAAHADQTLSMLKQPSDDESRLLGAWQYQHNHTVLHTDSSVLPPNRRAWASWNYLREEASGETDPVSVTYYMNLLQGLTASEDYCVTLNRVSSIDKSKIIREIDYNHPVFSLSAMASQAELPTLNGQNKSYFCGSYFGYGFHEDAVRSGVQVGRCFGLDL